MRPEGNAQWTGGTGDGPAPGDWGVYEPAGGPGGPAPYEPPVSERTMNLRMVPVVEAEAVGAVDDGTGEQPNRRAEGRAALRSGTGRRRASGPRRPKPRPKESALVVTARMVGELFITLGLVMLLFVSYQLWWTNVQADAAADGTRNQLEQQWAQPQPAAPGAGVPKDPGKFEPGQGFAIVYIPKLGLKYPIAEGTNKQQVLDKGLVGHYTGTAMPADKAGNFAIAAHRTTHGQPFRKLGELKPGDKIVVETATTFYTYEVAGGIPETPPNNVTVIQPVPKGSPFTQPGRYITLTTCTPEFSARGRLIVFGKMAGEQPRSQGQPAALTG
ncbi:class E sortase [Kitasatospora sp. NPDC049258]|uniref:class E sortase n=1 Tax=Kitasatospora sp. NPDC049258 TaxID=3155394 RepID=UPI00343B62BC